MSNVVEFAPSDRPITESEIDKLHSEAFRDLEPRICDCESMAKIAAQIVMSARIDESNREFVFAVVHVFEMLTALKANYYAAWHGEKQQDAHHEVPASIDEEAESATIGRSRKATEALTAQRRPSGI